MLDDVRHHAKLGHARRDPDIVSVGHPHEGAQPASDGAGHFVADTAPVLGGIITANLDDLSRDW